MLSHYARVRRSLLILLVCAVLVFCECTVGVSAVDVDAPYQWEQCTVISETVYEYVTIAEISR